MIRKQGENAIAERKKQLLYELYSSILFWRQAFSLLFVLPRESVNQDKENQEKDVEEEVSRVEKDLRAEWNKQISAVAEFKKTAKEVSNLHNTCMPLAANYDILLSFRRARRNSIKLDLNCVNS